MFWLHEFLLEWCVGVRDKVSVKYASCHISQVLSASTAPVVSVLPVKGFLEHCVPTERARGHNTSPGWRRPTNKNRDQ